MYKRQFAKWKWYKYSAHGRQIQRSDGKSCSRARKPACRGGTPTLAVIQLLHQDDFCRKVDTGLASFCSFLQGHLESDPIWIGTAKFNDVLLNSDAHGTFAAFSTAIVLLKRENFAAGGQMLRLAFLKAEERIWSHDPSAFFDLCIRIPHLFLQHGRLDILIVFLTHFASFASVSIGEQHPIARLSRLLSGLTLCDAIVYYIANFALLQYRTISQARGQADRSVLSAWHMYLAFDELKDKPRSDGFRRQYLTDYDDLRHEALFMYGPQSDIFLDLSFDFIDTQRYWSFYQEDFTTCCEGLISVLFLRNEAEEFSTESWMAVDIQRYSTYHFVLSQYHREQEDYVRATECGQRAMDASSDEGYLYFSCALEKILRLAERSQEADLLKRRREECEWLVLVQRTLDR
jgi:hypothetical protein